MRTSAEFLQGFSGKQVIIHTDNWDYVGILEEVLVDGIVLSNTKLIELWEENEAVEYRDCGKVFLSALSIREVRERNDYNFVVAGAEQ